MVELLTGGWHDLLITVSVFKDLGKRLNITHVALSTLEVYCRFISCKVVVLQCHTSSC